MHLRQTLRLIIARWPTIISLMLLAVAAAALLTYRTTPVYESTAQVYVTSTQAESAVDDTPTQRVESYARLVRGDRIAARVIDSLGLSISPESFSEKVSSEVESGTTIVRVSVSDRNSDLARQMARELSREFVDYAGELEGGGSNPNVRATVIDEASAPGNPVSPNTAVNLLLGGLIGLALGLVIAVIRALVDTSIKSADDLHLAVDATLLGSIAYDTTVPRTPLITSLDSHNPRLEAFRILRTNLQFIEIDRLSKVFVVSSSLPDEGKTATATNLAIAMAQSGKQACLVEGDLRRPRISDYVGAERSVGLTTVLLGRLPLDQALQPVLTPGLEVLTSGPLPPNPSELLQTNAMAELISELRIRFDVVIIDSPPLLPVTDAALLASIADGVILVVRHGKTSREQVRAAVERLESVGSRILGVVLNMTPARAAGKDAYGYGPVPVDKKSKARKTGQRQAT